jgi:predicted DNA-binding transcriptional regulator AlpA
MTMDQIRAALKDRKIALVAKATGLSRQSIYSIMNGKTEYPRVNAYNALVAYLTRKKL